MIGRNTARRLEQPAGINPDQEVARQVCQDTLHTPLTLTDIRTRGAGKWTVVIRNNNRSTQCTVLWGKLETVSRYTIVENRQNVARH